MKKAFIIAIAIASLALLSAMPAAAQSKPVPRTADGHPDMTGVWWPGHDLIPSQATAVYREGERQGVGAQSFGSLYKPEAKAKAKTLSDKDDPALWCIPSIIGPTPLVGNGLVGEIVMTPKTMYQLIETYHGFRIIPTDGPSFVLDAQRSLFAAEDQFAQSETAVSSDLVALFKALGGGWEEGETLKDER